MMHLFDMNIVMWQIPLTMFTVMGEDQFNVMCIDFCIICLE